MYYFFFQFYSPFLNDYITFVNIYGIIVFRKRQSTTQEMNIPACKGGDVLLDVIYNYWICCKSDERSSLILGFVSNLRDT